LPEFIMDKYFLICALVIASIGAISDVRTARIPNWLTYGGLAAAIVSRAAMGLTEFRSGLIGLMISGGMFLLLFLIGGMGGGDVKLMAAVGAWAGSSQSLPILITSSIVGGILAVLYMIMGRRILLTLRNSLELIQHHASSGLRPHPYLNVQEAGTMRVPYGLAIAMGTLYCLGNAFLRG
jgi:prepilin peptidase CpaA